jgi:hypothetical protein
MAARQEKRVRSRRIEDVDREAVADCLARSFPSRSRDDWRAALERIGRRAPVEDFPRCGLLLESDGKVVGVLLQIFSRRSDGSIVCHLSSWCLDPAYRGFAAMLSAAAVNRKDVVYVNISAAPHTLKGIEASGFRRYCDGLFLCAPSLSLSRRKARVAAFSLEAPIAARLTPYERDLLAQHAALGCDCLLLETDGEVLPFVFARRLIFKRRIPVRQLIYCRSIEDFAALSQALGRYLLRLGAVLVLADANGPIAGVPGLYLKDRGPKYYKAETPPRLGDLSFSELVFLGA